MLALYIILGIFALSILLYLLAIMPSFHKSSDIDELKKYYYAHRGFHDNEGTAPENSLKAFALACDNNYGMELDIQLTKDEKVVVFHDDTLKRVCGVEGKVCDFTYDELQKFNLMKSEEKIPLFSDVLKLVNGKTPIIVEFKPHNDINRLCELGSNLLDNYKGLYCMESFHPMAVLWYKKHRKNVVRGQLSCNFHDSKLPFVLVRFLMNNFANKPNFIAYGFEDKNNISRRICRKLYKNLSVAWTIKSQDDLNSCKNDFDLFIFEGFHPSI